jgi:hypothetical protein
MEQTTSQHLPYPTENDPANAALQLQVLAEAIDAKLVAQFALARQAFNVPAIMVNLSANQTGISNGTTTDILFDQILFEYPSGAWSLTPQFPFFPETGYYRIGLFVNSVPSGGVTANSACTITLRYPYVQQIPYTLYTIESYQDRCYQSNTSGEYQLIEAMVRCDVVNTTPAYPSAQDYSGITATINHANVASTVNVLAGSKMWAWKTSELED